MSILAMVMKKCKAFRFTVPSLILLVLASYRTLTSGDSIQLVGVCAGIVPFLCQFRNFPVEEGESPVKDVLSSYILSFVLMVLYLGWILLLTWLGSSFVPSYVANPYFVPMLLIAVCADVVFISAVVPLCRELKPMQRMIPALVLTNAMLIFMMMAASFVKNADLSRLPGIAGGFCGLVIFLTVSLIFAAYREAKT